MDQNAKSNIKPRKRNYKVVRAIETYRANRRNDVRGTDKEMEILQRGNIIRKSYVSKRHGKYMPHNGGNGWVPNLVYAKRSSNTNPLFGILPPLSTREAHINRKRTNTKYRKWKRNRASGLN